MNIQTKEFAYILGFIWADGYLGSNYIRIEALEEDLRSIEHIFLCCANFLVYKKHRNNRKPVLLFNLNDKKFRDFLFSKGYAPNSNESAFSILALLPKELHMYFYRGLSDGDGCFYINKNRGLYQYSLAGCYEQNWTFFEELLNTLEIKYSIVKREQIRKDLKKSHSSIVRITNKKDVAKLGKFLYGETFDFGLQRKYDKFRSILDQC